MLTLAVALLPIVCALDAPVHACQRHLGRTACSQAGTFAGFWGYCKKNKRHLGPELLLSN